MKRKRVRGQAYSSAVRVKLTDFGLSCRFDPNELPNRYCGTVTSMAPEIIKGSYYSQKVDCFSLGIALYELIFGRVPFQGDG